jgi:hypothetical protein
MRDDVALAGLRTRDWGWTRDDDVLRVGFVFCCPCGRDLVHELCVTINTLGQLPADSTASCLSGVVVRDLRGHEREEASAGAAAAEERLYQAAKDRLTGAGREDALMCVRRGVFT